jgi:hypothetical protein
LKLFLIKILLINLILFSAIPCFSQKKYKSPRKAAILSVFPGAGQFYTKKYWKIPIIYSGLIISAYNIKENNKKYKTYKELYINRINGSTDNSNYSTSQLNTIKDNYRRNREVSVMLFSLTYILNIVDASVNAHLFDFEINEDISLHINPLIINDYNYETIKLSLKF